VLSAITVILISIWGILAIFYYLNRRNFWELPLHCSYFRVNDFSDKFFIVAL